VDSGSVSRPYRRFADCASAVQSRVCESLDFAGGRESRNKWHPAAFIADASRIETEIFIMKVSMTQMAVGCSVVEVGVVVMFVLDREGGDEQRFFRKRLSLAKATHARSTRTRRTFCSCTSSRRRTRSPAPKDDAERSVGLGSPIGDSPVGTKG